MEQKDIELVQTSFEKVVPIASKAAEIFYGILFEMDPNLKPLFANSNMQDQGNKLMSTLTVVVRSLKTPEKIIPAAQELAKKHVKYGVKAEDYTTVGNALLQTLKKGLGAEFTPEVRAAWIEAYKLISRTMKDAAYG